MRIADLKMGDIARILSIDDGIPAYRNKLISMGLLPGTSFKVTRMAPLGDPIEIKVRGFSLSLRKREAAILQIEEA